jgi:hypothetical protein
MEKIEFHKVLLWAIFTVLIVALVNTSIVKIFPSFRTSFTLVLE